MGTRLYRAPGIATWGPRVAEASQSTVRWARLSSPKPCAGRASRRRHSRHDDVFVVFDVRAAGRRPDLASCPARWALQFADSGRAPHGRKRSADIRRLEIQRSLAALAMISRQEASAPARHSATHARTQTHAHARTQTHAHARTQRPGSSATITGRTKRPGCCREACPCPPYPSCRTMHPRCDTRARSQRHVREGDTSKVPNTGELCGVRSNRTSSMRNRRNRAGPQRHPLRPLPKP